MKRSSDLVSNNLADNPSKVAKRQAETDRLLRVEQQMNRQRRWNELEYGKSVPFMEAVYEYDNSGAGNGERLIGGKRGQQTKKNAQELLEEYEEDYARELERGLHQAKENLEDINRWNHNAYFNDPRHPRSRHFPGVNNIQDYMQYEEGEEGEPLRNPENGAEGDLRRWKHTNLIVPNRDSLAAHERKQAPIESDTMKAQLRDRLGSDIVNLISDYL